MVNASSLAYPTYPNAIPTRFGDNDALPVSTHQDETPDPGLNTGFFLKYNTSDGSLAWRKTLQGDVSLLLRSCDNGLWFLDKNNVVHAIIGFAAGTHLDGSITVPNTYTNAYQYYLVKLQLDTNNPDNPPAVLGTPLLLPVTGGFSPYLSGSVKMIYDENLDRYYIAGRRDDTPLSYNGNPFTKDGYMLTIDGAGNELWRKEFVGTLLDHPIFGLIKDDDSNVYISGRYLKPVGSDTGVPVTFGDYTFPIIYNAHNGVMVYNPFVIKMNPSGEVIWAKIPDGLSDDFGDGAHTEKAPIALNGNEIAFAKGDEYEIWGSFPMTRPENDKTDPQLVRLNKDTGEVIGTNEIHSDFGHQDELTAIATDKDGNYVVGGFFINQLFTDPGDGLDIMNTDSLSGESQFFIAKLAKSECGTISTEETASEAGMQFYPNPTSDVLLIRSKKNLQSYEVHSSLGQLVKSGDFSKKESSVSLENLPAGTYYVKVKTETATVTEKVIKK